MSRETSFERYCVDKLDENMLPLKYQMIYEYQQKYKDMVSELNHKTIILNTFMEA